MHNSFYRRLVILGIGLLVLGVIGLFASIGATRNGSASTGSLSGAVPAPTSTPAAVATPVIAIARAAHTSSSAPTSVTVPVSTTSVAAPASVEIPRPDVSPTAATTVYGISDPILINLPLAAQVERLKAMRAIGITSVRVDASWYWGQPNGPDTYDWVPLDEVVTSIRSVGLSADLIIDGCPPWAAVSSAAGDQFAQPASPTAFAKWAAAVAARYGKEGINYYEIWNEPNLADFWQPKPDPVSYTADLEAAYAAIKAVDSSVTVLSGGLAPGVDDGTNYDPRTFLEDMYADGAKGSFDGLGYHPYSYPDAPGVVESWSGWSMMSETSPSIRSIMTENGDFAKKIWITEYGAPTSGPNSVGDTGQSADLVHAISLVKRLNWVGSFYLYTWSDDPALSADANGFGLLSSENDPKPAYAAVAAALASSG
jgi:hypothetical protein